MISLPAAKATITTSAPRTASAVRIRRIARTAASVLALTAGFTAATQCAQADPLTGHPRMWVTAADLPKLRSWATDANPMFKNGLDAAAIVAKADVDAKWNWAAGKPNKLGNDDPNAWHDDGSSSFIGEDTEAYAQFFAFMSLVDPDKAQRPQWAKRAHVMLMWALNQAALGTSPGQPFRDPTFPAYNRANYWGEAWPLTVDWIYPSLTPADKATIRKVFMMWDNQLLTASTAGQEHPQPVGLYNSPKLLGNDASLTPFNQQAAQLQLRWAANNFGLGHMRMLAMTSMAMDAADDPLADKTKPATALGNTLRSYYYDVAGAWLYQTYSLFEEAPTVRAAYKLPAGLKNISLGLASAGLPVESSLYGESQGFIAETLLAMRTAGYDDTKTYGPQVGLFNSTYWTKALDGFLHALAPAPYTPSKASGFDFLGPIYPIASYGDILRAYSEPESTLTLAAAVGIADERAGNNPVRLQKARWIAANVPEGGAAKVYDRAANIWGNNQTTDSILSFLLFDPHAAKAADPRPAMPTKFVGPATGIILARTDWTRNATWFTARCSWESINHQSGDCGQFELHRKGQWLTKEWGNYANDGSGYTSLYHNNLGIQNHKPQGLGDTDLFWKNYLYGGQWNNGGNNGDATVTLSVNDNWAYSLTDAANLYNHPNFYTAAAAAMDVKKAARSLVWLNPDYVVVYDRATTTHAGEFKDFNLVLTAKPTITGNTAVASRAGQTLTVQSLMPMGATVAEQHFWKTDPSQEMDRVADLEPSTNRLVIAAPGNPADARFLTVLQGTDTGKKAATATAIHSSAGTPFDGAAVGNMAVMFPVDVPAAVTTTTFTAPAGVTRFLITGLVPGKAYAATLATAGGATKVTLKPGTGFTADIGGVIGIGFPSSKTATLGGGAVGFTMKRPS